jgi:hypothetical protein
MRHVLEREPTLAVFPRRVSARSTAGRFLTWQALRISQFERRHVGLAAALTGGASMAFGEHSSHVGAADAGRNRRPSSERLGPLVEGAIRPRCLRWRRELVGYMTAKCGSSGRRAAGRSVQSGPTARSAQTPAAFRQDLYASMADAVGCRRPARTLLRSCPMTSRDGRRWAGFGFGVTNVDWHCVTSSHWAPCPRGMERGPRGPADLDAVASLPRRPAPTPCRRRPLFMRFSR